MFNLIRVAVMTGLWVVSALLMIAWSLDSDRIVLAGWSVFVGLHACVFTGWCLLALERHRVETIATLTAYRIRELERADGLHSV